MFGEGQLSRNKNIYLGTGYIGNIRKFFPSASLALLLLGAPSFESLLHGLTKLRGKLQTKIQLILEIAL
jgi:hypothetical protein